MLRVYCFLALSLVLSAAAPADTVRGLLGAMEELHARQAGAHPLDARSLNTRILAQSAKLRALGPEAVRPLADYLRDKTRPLKVRLHAAAALGLLGDPAALAPLEALARDSGQDPGLRATALQGLASLRLEAGDLRATLDEMAADPAAPEALRREALSHLSGLGSNRPEIMLRLARAHGPAPRGLAQGEAAHALAAIGRSSAAPAALKTLFEALRYFRKGHPLRGRALAALAERRLKGPDLSREQIDALGAVALEEPGGAGVLAARLLGDIEDPRATKPLLRVLRSSEPAILAEAAEALARSGDPAAAAPLAKLEQGLASDKRFSPMVGAQDPRPFAIRIQQAVDALARP